MYCFAYLMLIQFILQDFDLNVDELVCIVNDLAMCHLLVWKLDDIQEYLFEGSIKYCLLM